MRSVRCVLMFVLASFVLKTPAEVRFDPLGNPISEEWMEQAKSVRSVIVVLKADASVKKGAGALSFEGLGSLKKMMVSSAPVKKGAAPVSAAQRNLDNMYSAEVLAADGLGEVLAQLNQSPLVEYAEPDWPIELFSAPNDTHFNPEQWSLHNTGQLHTAYNGVQEAGEVDADIDWLEAWEGPNFPTNEIVIAVIDTGVDYTHVDLTNQMWRNMGEAGLDTNGFDKATNGIDDDHNGYVDDYLGIDLVNTDTDPMDDNLHGTHVAGTIAAEANNAHGIAGVCPTAKIMPIKIFTAEGRSTGGVGIPAIRYAADNGAKVINNSWGGGGYSQALQDAITYANEKGTSVMCASGNNGSYMAMYPASYAGAVSVGATDSSDDRASFSNYGPWVDVMAPGHNILSLFSGSAPIPSLPYSVFDGDLLIISGTSMATPTATGAMGLLMSLHPGLEPWVYEKVMEATCDEGIYSRPSSAGFEGDLGAGRIDVDDMLAYAAPAAFVRSHVDLHLGFGRSFLAPGEATNLVIKVGTWIHDVENLEVSVAALDADSTLSATNYVVGNLSAGTVVNIPEETFVVGCTADALWNTAKRFRVQLKSGDTVLETRTNGFSVYNGQVSEFCTADMDGDGVTEVIGKFGGVVSVFDPKGTLKWFYDLGQNWSIVGSPAVGDVDGDGTNEVVIVAEQLNFIYSTQTHLVVLEHDGSIHTNRWPVDLQAAGIASTVWNTAKQPSLMDADHDGDLDIVLSGHRGTRAQYGVYDEFGRLLGADSASTSNRFASLTSVGDIDDDGTNEVVSIEHGLVDDVACAWLCVRDQNLNMLYTIDIEAGTDVAYGGYLTAPAMADVDFDGEKEFVTILSLDEVGYLTVIKQDGTVLDGFPVQVDNSTDYDVPVLADVDGDGDIEMFSYRADFKQILGFDHQGNSLPNFPISDTSLPGMQFANGYRVTIGDVDGDGEPELVYAGNYQVDLDDDSHPYSFDIMARDFHDGMMVPGFPKTLLIGGFSWNFGDGTAEQSGVDLAQPTHDYAAPGVYSVSLTLSNTAGEVHSATYENYITVYSDLTTDFVHSPTGAQTAPVRIDFTDLSQNGPQYWFWEFGDGSTSTEQHPQHIYTNAGTFTVTLSVSNDFGAAGSSAGQEIKPGLIEITSVQPDATNHYVSVAGSHIFPYKTWAEAATNLSAAFSAMEPGHTLWVTNGVYKIGGHQKLIVDEITMRSVNGPDVTIIDGEDLYPGLQFAGTNSVLDGFTIQRCVGQQPALSLRGLRINDGAGGATARNMIIRDNERMVFGGTVYLSDGFLVDSLVISNKCYTGSGVFAFNSMVSNCVFKGNESQEGSTVVLSADSELHNSLVAENTGLGGVELVTGGHVYNTTIANNTIIDNLGGGLFFDGIGDRNSEENPETAHSSSTAAGLSPWSRNKIPDRSQTKCSPTRSLWIWRRATIAFNPPPRAETRVETTSPTPTFFTT